MFSSGITRPTVPFCPHLEQNLSPTPGIRSSLTLTFASLNPSSPSVINDLSTYPICPFLGTTESSFEIPGSDRFIVILPMRIFLSSNKVFSLIIPYSSNSE